MSQSWTVTLVFEDLEESHKFLKKYFKKMRKRYIATLDVTITQGDEVYSEVCVTLSAPMNHYERLQDLTKIYSKMMKKKRRDDY